MLSPEATAAELEHVIDQLETGLIPRGQVFDSIYADLMSKPLDTIRDLYQRMGFGLDSETEQRMRRFLEGKPKGKFGGHRYEMADDPRARACYARYQRYYGVPNE